MSRCPSCLIEMPDSSFTCPRCGTLLERSLLFSDDLSEDPGETLEISDRQAPGNRPAARPASLEGRLSTGMLLGGRYRIVALLGSGGMGEVYRARDEHLGRVIALKVLGARSLGDEQARRRFRREAEALSKLNHPCIATVHDFATEEDVDFLVMEHVEGLTLGQRLAQRPMTEKEVLRIGLQIAEALDQAHGRGVVHRDLKPDNIKITPGGQVKVLDFGLAKLLRPAHWDVRSGSPSETQNLAGTLPYMAPEQVRGGTVDSRTDIYALGAVLYEMATGQRPFPERHIGRLIHAILNVSPAAPGRVRHPLSPDLERLILKCLDKDPANRYPSAKEVALELRRLATPQPVAAARPARRTGRVAALAAIITAVAVTAVYWRGQHEERRPVGRITPSIAVLPFADMSSQGDQEYFSDGLAEELRSDLNKVPGLRVTGSASSRQFKGKDDDPRVIGEKLNVSAILEGSVRKEGERVRITARLVDARDGFQKWSEIYDRKLDDIFAVQEEIARSVVGALQVSLRERGALSPHTNNPDAYNACLLGRYFYGQQTRESLEKAVDHFNQAIRLDPGYAAAWAGLGATYAFQAGLGYVVPQEGYGRARNAVERALELDDNLAQAHAVLGWIRMTYDWDWGGADASFQKALSLEPGTGTIEAAQLAVALGRFERALDLARQAVRLDPVSAQALATLGLAAWYGGRPEEAVTAYKKALELLPDYPVMHGLLGELYLSQARPEDALAELEQVTDAYWRLPGMAMAYHTLGRTADSDAALAAFIDAYRDGGAYNVAQVYAYRGRSDAAFHWLAQAHANRDGGLFLVKTDPLLATLRTDPRYAALLKRMRLQD